MMTPRFSKESLAFILKASRQKRPDWLDQNRAAYERLLLEPLHHLAATLKSELGTKAPGYHFPQKGIGRLKRAANRVKDGGGRYRDWMHYAASRPSGSRFERNPSLFFMINPTDREDPVLIAGGLYMPSSRQVRAIREAIAHDASAFEALFRSREFSNRFQGGFAREKVSSRPPRGFDPHHPKIDWLKLQAFYVWKPYSIKVFSSPGFAKTVVKDFLVVLKLNAFLDQAIAGKFVASKSAPKRSQSVSGRIETVDGPKWEMDF